MQLRHLGGTTLQERLCTDPDRETEAVANCGIVGYELYDLSIASHTCYELVLIINQRIEALLLEDHLGEGKSELYHASWLICALKTI